jgi:putative FmdB family regulatory protein
MPIYEYECRKCGRRFEFLQRFGEEPKTVCSCGEGGALRRVISAPAIQFKGDGWYVTDYARKNSKTAESTEKEAKSQKGEGTANDGGADE